MGHQDDLASIWAELKNIHSFWVSAKWFLPDNLRDWPKNWFTGVPVRYINLPERLCTNLFPPSIQGATAYVSSQTHLLLILPWSIKLRKAIAWLITIAIYANIDPCKKDKRGLWELCVANMLRRFIPSIEKQSCQLSRWAHGDSGNASSWTKQMFPAHM